MGRRKIEIKAIKDDRNRSVTFLKRKGGLFKKAHELSVLCSVDVAVIIFGSNKKLYEFSSGDIHQTLQRYHYSQPHEHKGPADFADKDGGDDDDDEDMGMGTPPQDNPSPPQHGIVQHPLQDQPGLQHMRHRSTPSASASPPMVNGAFQPHRLSTPQPHPGSRPSSRNHVRRTSSNLVPQHHPNPQAAQAMQQQGNYMYQTPPQYGHPHQQSAYMRPHQGTPPINTPPMQHHHFSHPPPQSQMQHLYLQDQRRQSMPPNMPVHTQQEQAQQGPMMHTPPQPSRPFQSPPLPGPSPQRLPPQRAPGHSQGLGVMHGQPQYDNRPQQQWQQTPETEGAQHNQSQAGIKEEDVGPRPQSIDVGAAMRHDSTDTQSNYGPPPPGSAPIHTSHHAPSGSTSSMPAPSRVNSLQNSRPKLSVQIPGEAAEEAGQQNVEDSSKETSKTSSTPAKAGSSETTHHSNLVLPAPSPRSASAGAVLSAGATGPTNPFARPNIPRKQENNNNESFKDASPMSALPSRVMQEHGYMSSPSSMFPELGFGSMHGNTLASPAVYQPTPINYHGPSFRDEPSDKRKKSPGDDEGGTNKKPKSG